MVTEIHSAGLEPHARLAFQRRVRAGLDAMACTHRFLVDDERWLESLPAEGDWPLRLHVMSARR